MALDLAQWIDRFDALKVLVLGEYVLDQHWYGEAEAISPEAPVPVLRVRNETARPGGAGHVAAALAALGLDVACCGGIGSDPAGDRLVQALGSVDVRTDGLIGLDGWQTTTHTRLIGLAQHRHPQQMMRVESAAGEGIPRTGGRRVLEAVRERLDQVDVVCLRDGEEQPWPESLCREAVEAVRGAGRPILVSPAPGVDWDRYRGATVLTPNRRKLARAAGVGTALLGRVAELAEPIRDRLELEAMVVTLDRDGAMVVPCGGDAVPIPTHPRSVYDITGAGDVMLAVLSAARAAGADWVEAAALSNVAAGLSVERVGPVTIGADELRADLGFEGRAGASKLRTVDGLLAELASRRASGSRVVFTNGCFDVLHAGHIQYFKFCRQHGDVVVVGLNSDASVRSQDKGDDRPINNQLDRARMLSALEDIDYVVIFDDPTPEDLIRSILPDALVKGADWSKWVCGREIVEANGGEVILAPMLQGYSTTELLARIRGMEERRERDD